MIIIFFLPPMLIIPCNATKHFQDYFFNSFLNGSFYNDYLISYVLENSILQFGLKL